MAAYLTENGTLPESRQGQGAFHTSHLNNPDIISALRIWASGALELKDGGFEGSVSFPNISFQYSDELPR
jgi:hypothetical protein